MFGFICNAVCAVACFSLGMPVIGCCAAVGGLVYLIPVGGEED